MLETPAYDEKTFLLLVPPPGAINLYQSEEPRGPLSLQPPPPGIHVSGLRSFEWGSPRGLPALTSAYGLSSEIRARGSLLASSRATSLFEPIFPQAYCCTTQESGNTGAQTESQLPSTPEA